MTDLAMMFSGGTDTTLAAARILDADPSIRLHLLTFCNGICVGVDNSRVHALELRRMYGEDRVIHEIRYVTEFFRQVRSPLLDLIREYDSTLVFDLCCRLSMESAAILYAREHGIAGVCDGTNLDQGRLFLERPEYLEVSRSWFRSFGVDYSSPVYARSGGRVGRREELIRRGFTVGPKVFERFNVTTCLFQQPFCLMAFHTFFFTSFLREAPGLRRFIARHTLTLDRAIELRLEREALARPLMEARLGLRTTGADGQELRVEDRSCSTLLCGRDAVEVAWPMGTVVDLDALARCWDGEGRHPTRTAHHLEMREDGTEIRASDDGRVLISGTHDRQRAEALAQRHVARHGVLCAG